MKMKRVIGLILACLLMLVFTGCAGEEAPVETTATNGTEESTEPSESVEPSESADDEEVELIVFAAASMTETLTQIQEMYKEVAPNVTLTFNFDSSGTLVTRSKKVRTVISSSRQRKNRWTRSTPLREKM